MMADSKEHILVNCADEIRLFDRMLSFGNTPHRVLSIAAASGTGKSGLLRKLKHHCIQKGVPVSLQEATFTDPFDFTERLVNDYKRQNVNFPSFTRLNDLRLANRFDDLLTTSSSRQPKDVTVSVQGTDFSYATGVSIIGVQNNIQVDSQSANIGSLFQQYLSNAKDSLRPEQDKRAKEICTEAFTEDLVKHCSARGKARESRTIVVLLDVFEKSNDDFREWLLESFFERHFFDYKGRPSRMIMVIVGQERPNYGSYWATTKCTELILEQESLSGWSEADTHEYLQSRKVTDTRLIDYVTEKVSNGRATPQVASSIVDYLTNIGMLTQSEQL